MKFALGTLLSILCILAQADEEVWRTTWDGALYSYANSMSLRDDSLLNPFNQIAKIPQRSDVTQFRLNLRAESETIRFTVHEIASTQESRSNFRTQSASESYLSQWQARVRIAEDWNIAVGREVLNWGAGRFRSPSSPFYFDNGRTDPTRALIGMDSEKISWTPDIQHGIHFVHVESSGYGAVEPDVWRNSWLAIFDQRSDVQSYGLVVAKSPVLDAFFGAHGEYTINDEWMLYGELGSSVLPNVLQSSADATQPFIVQPTSPRRTAALVGGTYTFEEGQSLNVELLHDGHGYTTGEESAYFQRGISQNGLALTAMPRLLGSDYLNWVLQSNLMESSGNWLFMVTHNLTDNGNLLTVSGQKSLSTHVGTYAQGVIPIGNVQQEFSALYTYSIAIGLIITIP